MIKKTKVKKEHSLRTEMTSFQSRVSRSSVIGFIGLEKSQYQTWSYLLEIDRVYQWLLVLKGTTNISLSL
jgi:hypothetical protein